MALAYAGVECELREVSLKQKPLQMLVLSAKGTVPVLQLENQVIDESLEVMAWALSQSKSSVGDADSWAEIEFPHALVEVNDGEFKKYLDRYKYFERFQEHPQTYYLDKCMPFLIDLETRLTSNSFLLTSKLCWVDVAIFPFIRQFAYVDKSGFDDLPLPMLQKWLNSLLESELFASVMPKYPLWEEGQERLLTHFPKLNSSTSLV